ncbi:MAG: ATP-binding protein [bacterium]
MNGNHSAAEWKYRRRWLGEQLRKAADAHPVLVLTGARQVGKSTLLQHEAPFSGWRYQSLDELDVRDQARREPEALWAGAQQVIIDEVQRVPELLSAVKREVDRRQRRVRFALTGSANLAMMSSVSESLAGRAVSFVLPPMTIGEATGGKRRGLVGKLLAGELPRESVNRAPEVELSELLVRGFVPPVLGLPDADAVLRWWEGYVSTYLERDLRQLSQVESLPDFRRVMEAFALRSGQLVNQTEVSRDVGVSQPSVHRYLGLLETSMVVHRLPAFFRNRTKRLIKRPKLYFLDPALAAFLVGHFDAESLLRSREAGALFETLVHLQLRAAAELLTPKASIFYWRTTTGREVDFVLEQGRRLVGFEVKLSPKPRYEDTAGLRLFLQEYPEADAAVLVHAGNRTKRLGDKIVALPWYLLS